MMCPENETDKILADLEAAHQARVSGQMLEQLKERDVEVQQIAEENDYAALLEQRRHIYSSGNACSSWSSNDCTTWQDCGYYDNCYSNCYGSSYGCQEQLNRIEKMVREIYQKVLYCKYDC